MTKNEITKAVISQTYDDLLKYITWQVNDNYDGNKTKAIKSILDRITITDTNSK